jgi:hypothetical protein
MRSVVKKKNLGRWLAGLLAVCILAGCQHRHTFKDSLESVTRVIKGEQVQIYPFSLRQTVFTTAATVQSGDLRLKCIEFVRNTGFVQAASGHYRLRADLHRLDDEKCQVRIQISDRSGRTYASLAQRVLGDIYLRLQRGPAADRLSLTNAMQAVYQEPDAASAVVSYLASGAQVNIVKNKGEWTLIRLRSEGIGYFRTDTLQPLKQLATHAHP